MTEHLSHSLTPDSHHREGAFLLNILHFFGLCVQEALGRQGGQLLGACMSKNGRHRVTLRQVAVSSSVPCMSGLGSGGPGSPRNVFEVVRVGQRCGIFLVSLHLPPSPLAFPNPLSCVMRYVSSYLLMPTMSAHPCMQLPLSAHLGYDYLGVVKGCLLPPDAPHALCYVTWAEL